MIFRPLLLIVFVCITSGVLLPGCQHSEEPSEETASSEAMMPLLRDITNQSGIELTTTSGADQPEYILEVNGSGVALFDGDGDGDLDLFVANGSSLADLSGGPGSRYFQNITTPGQAIEFKDATIASGLNIPGWSMGVAVGDVDGDGHLDLYVTRFGANVLMRNTGDPAGRFEDITAAAGVGDDRWGTSAAMGDIDSDGDLDLYVVNYLDFDVVNPPKSATYKDIKVMAGPHGLEPQADVLYINDGHGVFQVAPEASGINNVSPSFGLNVLMLDIDSDGDQDILVGNDSMPNFYLVNDGQGVFDEMGAQSGLAANMDGGPQATMGMAVADLNDDGLADFFSTNFSSDTNTLHMSAGSGFYDDRSGPSGLGVVSRSSLGWATGFIDFDQDGVEELFILNGHVYPQATMEQMDSAYAQPPELYVRNGNRFALVKGESLKQWGPWLAEPRHGRAATWGDLDRDGDVDLITADRSGPLRLYENTAAKEGVQWLTVSLRDSRDAIGNSSGLGAVVTAQANGRVQRRWLIGGGSFQSAVPTEAYFAFAADVESVEITVIWADGFRQTQQITNLDQHLVIDRP